MTEPMPDLMPDQITVFCDECGDLATRDYLVREDDGQKVRFAIARAHLSKNEGWRCDRRGDYCSAGCAARADRGASQ